MDSLNEYLNLLFRRGEYINVAKESVRETGSVPVDRRVEGRWICANPLYPGSSRKQVNVYEYRNLVIEMDQPDMTQAQQMEAMTLPYTTAVFSGNKSVHFVIALAEAVDRDTYKALCRRIKVWGEGLIDPACLEPARLTRMPREGQPMLKARQRVSLNELDQALPQVAKEEYVRNRSEIKIAPVFELTKKARDYLTGQTSREDAHGASLHAAKNLFELGMTYEQTMDMMRTARWLYMPYEPREDNKYKTRKIVDWVAEEWDVAE